MKIAVIRRCLRLPLTAIQTLGCYILTAFQMLSRCIGRASPEMTGLGTLALAGATFYLAWAAST
jgi:hypothetical protein